jgi:hypothetical protein
MNLDQIIHPVKSFAELDSEDVTAFLRNRKFGSESLVLEFKSALPFDGTKSGAGDICELVVGFLNAEGGVIVYGVSDRVNDPSVPFPDYVSGITEQPSPEKLSQWVKEFIYPPIDLPPARVFNVAGRKVVILKIAPAPNKPYCLYDPDSNAVRYFKRTGTMTATLTPAEVRQFYRTRFAEQFDSFLRDAELRERIGGRKIPTGMRRLRRHQKWVKTKLENPKEFGFVGVYTLPTRPVEIPWSYLNEFLTQHRARFSSELTRSGETERLQDGVSAGYFPHAIRQDIKSTHRTTLYTGGLVALDSQADPFMDSESRGLGKILHPYWLSYELQRHLQLSRTVLEPWNVDRADLIVEFENIEDFSMGFQGGSSYVDTSPYLGFHLPIERKVRLSQVYKYDDVDRRNIAMETVKGIMDEVCRIFGNAQPPELWDERGYLTYVKGAENTR